MHILMHCVCSVKKVYWSKMHYSAPFTKTIKDAFYNFYFMLSSVKNLIEIKVFK